MSQQAIQIVIIAAIIAILLIALPAMGIVVPAFVIKIGWVIFIACKAGVSQ